MGKVVYLFGAGASADALPLVKPIYKEIHKALIRDPYRKLKPEEKLGIKRILVKGGLPEAFVSIGNDLVEGNTLPENQEYVTKLKEQFEDLAKHSKKFDTIDTYAKYCYLKNPDELRNIKNLILIYFAFVQGFKKCFDNRYLVFLTTILENYDRIPDEIKILSWNYDSQFQIASEHFINEHNYFDPAERKIRTRSLLKYFPGFLTNDLPPLDLYSTYSLLHLNGIAGYQKSEAGESGNHLKQLSIITDFYRKEAGTIDEFIKFTKNLLEKYPSLIRFAWEREVNPKKVLTLDIAKAMVMGASILVVIGYSFPFFNREVDRQIINTLKNSGLKKIYYQNLNSGDFLASQFDIDKKIIESYDRVEQFLVPHEF